MSCFCPLKLLALILALQNDVILASTDASSAWWQCKSAYCNTHASSSQGNSRPLIPVTLWTSKLPQVKLHFIFTVQVHWAPNYSGLGALRGYELKADAALSWTKEISVYVFTCYSTKKQFVFINIRSSWYTDYRPTLIILKQQQLR